MLRELDLSSARLAPDRWLPGCGAACRLRWAEGWVAAHLQEALRWAGGLRLGWGGMVAWGGWSGWVDGWVEWLGHPEGALVECSCWAKRHNNQKTAACAPAHP